MPNEAEQWRTSKLAEQSPELKVVIDMWQGSPEVTLEALCGRGCGGGCEDHPACHVPRAGGHGAVARLEIGRAHV